MLNQKPLDLYSFLDIETTSQYPTFDSMPQQAKDLFFKRWEKDIFKTAEEPLDIPAWNQSTGEKVELPLNAITMETGLARAVELVFNKNAPLYAEWNKIICITTGKLDIKNDAEYVLKMISISGDDEKKLLETFIKANSTICGPEAQKLAHVTSDKGTHIVAHNGLVFDIPVIYKRMVYNNMIPPVMFRTAGLKPWDVKWIMDTKDYWKCGVFDPGFNVSLDQLSYNFGIESSKQIMQGKDVKDLYWKAAAKKPEAGINFAMKTAMMQLETYCEADVVALCKVFLKMMLIDKPVKGVKFELDKVLAAVDKLATKAPVNGLTAGPATEGAKTTTK